MTDLAARPPPPPLPPPTRSTAADPLVRRAAFWSVAALAFTIPWEGVVAIEGIGRLSRAVGLLSVPICLFALVTTGWRRGLLDVHVVLIAFAGWVIASQMWALAPVEAAERAEVAVQLVAMLLLLWEFAGSPRRVRQLEVAVVAGAAVAALLVIATHLSGDAGSRARVSETAHPNDVAFAICLAVPIAWHAALRCRSSVLRWLLLLHLPLGAFAIVLTASRSAVLLLAVSLAVVPWTLPAAGRATRAWTAGILGAALLVGPGLLPEAQVERLSTISASLESGSFNGREAFWAIAADGVQERPLTGWGGGGSRVLIREGVGEEFGVHNTYLSVAADLGLVGLGLLLLALLAIGRHLKGAAVVDRRAGAVLLATLLLGFMPRHWEYRKGTWLVIAILIAVAVVGTTDRPDPSDGVPGAH